MSQLSHKHFNIIIGSIAALSGITAFLAYMDNRRHKVLKDDLLKLEHELKTLEIEKAKNQLDGEG